MKPEKWNTPLVAGGAAILGAGFAAYQVTGNWFSTPSEIATHIWYIAAVAAAFGIVCGLASALMNRWAK